MRRQFGIKLHTHDACNLECATWRIEPVSEFIVSIKSNPGMHSTSELGGAEAGAVCLPPRYFRSQSPPVHYTAIRKDR
jgi:hypothetical protein